MSIIVLIRKGEPGRAVPICASDNPAVARAALDAMRLEVLEGVDATPELRNLGIILEPAGDDAEPHEPRK